MKDLFRLWQLFRPVNGWLSLGVAVSLITLLANVSLMAVSAWFITAMAVAGATGVPMNYFTPAAMIRASAIFRTLGRYGERLITHEATFRVIANLRVWFYQQLEPLAPAGLQHLHSGDLLSRIRADIDALDHLYLRVLLPVMVATISLILFFGFLLWFDLGIALLVTGCLSIAGVIVPAWINRLGSPPSRRIVAAESLLRAAAVDGIQGLPELLVYGAAEQHTQRIQSLSREIGDDQIRLGSFAGLSQGAVGLSANLALWGVLWLGIPLLVEGRLPPPQLTMLALFTLASFEAVMPLPTAFQHLAGTLAAVRRLFEIADAQPMVAEPAGPSPKPTRFDLTIDELEFSYPEAPRPALADVYLNLPQGRRVALVGATGSGKSTLLHLLLRFREPLKGTILLGGHPLGAFRSDELRSSMAVVSQHTHLFNASIRDNLLLANPEASDQALEHACRAAQVHDFIAGLPDGYETWAGETGVRLSGGQARRIAIARALLKDTPILLLDEPTEGLDGRTERALMQAIIQLMQERTVILVTHRPGALETMDEILLLEQGRVVERGSHRQLLCVERYRQLLRLDVLTEKLENRI